MPGKKSKRASRKPRHAADAAEQTRPNRPEPERERELPETLIPGAAEDDLAEELGEESVETATSGQSMAEDNLNEEVPEETGGPFVETSGKTVFGHGSRPRNK